MRGARRKIQRPTTAVAQQQFSTPVTGQPIPKTFDGKTKALGKHQKFGTQSVASYQQGVPFKLVASALVTLHGISPGEIYADYLSGKYSKAPEFLRGISQEDSLQKFKPVNCSVDISKDASSSYCLHTDVTGETFRSTTTNIPAFNGKPGGMCYWCRRTYTIVGLGYPVRPPAMVNGVRKYVTDDNNTCCPECLVAHVISLKLPYMYLDWTLDMLRYAYGVENAIPANNYRLLEGNGGTEPYETWAAKHGKYARIDGVLVTPSKREYRIS